MEKYQVIFYGDGEEVPHTEQYFNSKIEAEKWAENQEWDEQVEFWGNSGPEYKTQYHYHNPQDKQNYDGYEVISINELNEEFYRMQKLAGLLTEEEYKAKLWYKDYHDNISKSLNNLKQTLKNEGYNIK
jgi:hypothetical protein